MKVIGTEENETTKQLKGRDFQRQLLNYLIVFGNKICLQISRETQAFRYGARD